MNGINHLLNIGALATWLSVAGFGTVGVVLQGGPGERLAAPTTVRETEWLPDDFELGDVTSVNGAVAETETPSASDFEPLPAPPELPAIAASEPLPAIPSLPEPTRKPAVAESTGPSVRAAVSGVRKSSGKNKGGTGSSSVAGMSDAARIAAGSKPKPAYPFTARLKRQSGTVFVTFTVGTDGRVVSAHASKPCPHPLLNNAAVLGIRQWRFPPGGVFTRTQPITFTLD